jgi:hypothetical protein
MGYIPDDAEWYIAELVMEIVVHGARCNVVHRNLVLLHAHSPDEAYAKALQNGQNSETQYKNSKDQFVEIHFRGIAQLDVLYEPMTDGAELWFEEQLAVPESEIQAMVLQKEKLKAFTPPNPGLERDPDYGSKAVRDKAVSTLVSKKENL